MIAGKFSSGNFPENFFFEIQKKKIIEKMQIPQLSFQNLLFFLFIFNKILLESILIFYMILIVWFHMQHNYEIL